jgi:hypothetical protein
MTVDPTPDPTAPGLLHLRTWLEPGLDEGFSDWCDGHHADQLALPGFRRVRRFSLVRSAAPEPPGYLTVYDLDRLDVLESEAYAAHRERATGLPDLLQGRLRAARSDAWVVAAGPSSPDSGPTSVVVPGCDPTPLPGAGSKGWAHLFVPAGPGAPDLEPWFTADGAALVDAAGGTSARLLRSIAGEQVVVVELDDEPDALDPSALPRPSDLDGTEGETGWGLYRLDHVATPEGPVASPHRDRRNGS